MKLITIKTNYGRKLEEVFKRMQESRAKTAELRGKDGFPGIYLQVRTKLDKKYGWKPQTWWVTKVGCSSFGIEIFINQSEWTAIEQLSRQQQLRVANAIDWSTLE